MKDDGRNERVTTTFAFLLKNGDLTDRLVVFDDEPQWASSDELAALAFAHDLLYDSWVSLLETSRRVLKASPVVSELEALRSASKRRADTIWNNGYVDCPLLPKWALWFSAELSLVEGSYHLEWSIGAKAKYAQHILECAPSSMKIGQGGRGAWLSYDAGVPEEGCYFEEIANRCLVEIEPVLEKLLVSCQS